MCGVGVLRQYQSFRHTSTSIHIDKARIHIPDGDDETTDEEGATVFAMKAAPEVVT